MLETLCAAALVLCILALLGSRRAASRAVAPLRGLTEAVGRVSLQDPSERLPVPESPSELRTLVQGLNALLQRVEENVSAHAQFSSNIAHELRTPVTTLLADVQLMLETPADGQELHAFLVRAETELRHLGRLVDSFLILARIEGGLRTRAVVHMADVVRAARQRCQEAARQKAVRLELDTPETMPGHDPFVAGDAELLQALVENLIRNAIQHSPAGARVSISVHRADDRVRVTISDSGSGIPRELEAAVFERGFRVSSFANGTGFGLGLSIADSVARLHEGRIELQQSSAGGCTFCVDLPAIRGEYSAAHD